MGEPQHLVVELVRWSRPEEYRGVAGGVAVPLLSAVTLRLAFVSVGKEHTKKRISDVQDPSS